MEHFDSPKEILIGFIYLYKSDLYSFVKKWLTGTDMCSQGVKLIRVCLAGINIVVGVQGLVSEMRAQSEILSTTELTA